MKHRRIKITIALLCCILAMDNVCAQNGKYKVTNQNELATTMLEQSLRSSLPTIFSEEPERERAGMAPAEIDTTELMDEMSNVLAQWIMLQASNEEQKALTSAIPARVIVNENAITLTDDKDVIIKTYAIDRVNAGNSMWSFFCSDGVNINLVDQNDGSFILSVPQMNKIKMILD